MAKDDNVKKDDVVVSEENKELKTPKEPKTSKEPKTPKEPKEPKEPKTPKVDENTVKIDKDTLKTLVEGFESMKQKVEDLEGAANLGRLERVKSARDKGELVKTAKVSLWQGKMILGWQTVVDDVYVDERGRIIEDQQIKLFVDEGEGKEPTQTDAMPYKMFARLSDKLVGEVIKESKNLDGSVEFTLKFEDGREVTLPITFLN